MKLNLIAVIFFFVLQFKTCFSQSPYFPPLNGNQNWETLSPISLSWCINEIDSLYNFLQQKNSKGFIVLKDGKIVLEKYFGTFTKDSLWYWASAGKTITSMLVGIAQEENYLNINDTSSEYLGLGWTDCSITQENKIRILNQLTMTTGLDDAVSDNHCTIDTCLIYKADANLRWAYHNAPYTLLEQVITNATSQNINSFTQNKLKNKTGMTGFWLTSGYDNVYYSNARSMARFGLLFQNNCIWNTDTVLKDSAYIRKMTSTSQNLNLAYGYLWWLNGKTSYMVPGSQILIPGSYAPHAPTDMFAGIGKNGQILSVSKSKGIVLLRMGNPAGSNIEVPTVLCDQIWERLNKVMCNSTQINLEENENRYFYVYPNPANTTIHLSYPQSIHTEIKIFNLLGEQRKSYLNVLEIDLGDFKAGAYLIQIDQGNWRKIQKILIE